MREIRFRGKCIDDVFGLWRHGDLVRRGNEQCFIREHQAVGGWLEYEVDPKTVGQYIGLKDKNDREIYENDIVSDGGVIGKVEYFEGLTWDSGGSFHPGFYCREWFDYDEASELGYHLGFDHCEIVGNNTDNPGLLK